MELNYREKLTKVNNCLTSGISKIKLSWQNHSVKKLNCLQAGIHSVALANKPPCP